MSLTEIAHILPLTEASIEKQVPRYSLSFKLWSGRTDSHSPTWWNDYNEIKHNRTNNFSKATLLNALNSLLEKPQVFC